MRKLDSCNSYITTESKENTTTSFYSVGEYDHITATGEGDERVYLEVFCRSGKEYAWNSSSLFLVGFMMYGISITPYGKLLFAQQRHGGLLCLDIITGAPVWRTKTKAEISHIFVNRDTICCAAGRKTLLLLDIASGEILKQYFVPYDNRFITINDSYIINHTRANQWEVIDPASLSVIDSVASKALENDFDRSLWKKLQSMCKGTA